MPQRQGRERVGSHEVVDETVRVEDSWHEEGFVEGGDQQRSREVARGYREEPRECGRAHEEVRGLGRRVEDLRVTVIIDLRTKDLKEHLELITREMKYKEVREEIMSFVERKRDLFGTQLKAMEVDNYEEMGDQVWWGVQ